jgi:hypothetical protein
VWIAKESIGMFTVDIIEYAAYLYTRTLSLNSTTDIIQAWFNKEVLDKKTLLNHLEILIDKLPSYGEVTQEFKPKRSGYYAWDGLWLKYRGEDGVLLICFDTETLDILNYHFTKDENYEYWGELIDKVEYCESGILAESKGFFMDGELGLMKQLKKRYPKIPKQLCAFHKYSRVGQIIPLVRAKGINLEIKTRVEKVIFADTKQEAMVALLNLKRYAQEHQENAKLKKIIGVLKCNFDLLLTHFDHPEMSPYNNVLEGFNHIVKRKFRLMKGFKKEPNIDRWLKLILLDYRFHTIRSSKFANRNGKSPLQLSGVNLPKHFNWIKLVRKR